MPAPRRIAYERADVVAATRELARRKAERDAADAEAMATGAREAEFAERVGVIIANDNAVPYSPHEPTPKQLELLALDTVLEVFFGGAAGGGKTDGLLMAALKYIDVPGYSALILRRNTQQMMKPDAVLSRALEWLLPLCGKRGSKVHWSWDLHAFTFQCSGGGTSTLTFGHMEHENNKYDYQSAAYHFVAFEELTQFTQTQYVYMFSRLRRPTSGPAAHIPLRMRSTGNPGGVGHQWVFERFVNEETRNPRAVFIPSFLHDNPHIDATGYIKSLDEMDPYSRKQLLEGVWNDPKPGDIFDVSRITMLDSMAQVPELMATVRFWDFAATDEKEATAKSDFTASCKMGVGYDGVYYILDVTEEQFAEGEHAKKMQLSADEDGRLVSVRWEEEGGSSGKYASHAYSKELAGYDVAGIRSTGNKTVRARSLAVAVYNRKVFMVRSPIAKKYLAMLHSFPVVAHDDMVDASSGAFNHLESHVVGIVKIENIPMPSVTRGLYDEPGDMFRRNEDGSAYRRPAGPWG